MYHRCLNDRTSQYTSPFTVPHCPARDISVPLSEIYCTYHVTDSTRTAAPGLLSLLVRPTGTVFRTLSAIRTPPKLLSGACLRHFRSHGTSAQRIGEGVCWLGCRYFTGGLYLPAPDQWLTGDHFVHGKLSAMSQPTRPAQPSIPLGSATE